MPLFSPQDTDECLLVCILGLRGSAHARQMLTVGEEIPNAWIMSPVFGLVFVSKVSLHRKISPQSMFFYFLLVEDLWGLSCSKWSK